MNLLQDITLDMMSYIKNMDNYFAVSIRLLDKQNKCIIRDYDLIIPNFVALKYAMTFHSETVQFILMV